MGMKASLLLGGLLLLAGSLPTAEAAGRCMPSRHACQAGNAAARVPDDAPMPEVGAASDEHGGREHGGRVPLVAPIDSSPRGQTYGRWAAEWVQWALSIPAAVNPVLDVDGSNCAQRQVDKVWFLAGRFDDVGVARSCTIPAGRALFFPLINNAYFAFLNDPPETRTEKFVRSIAACTRPAEISVWIDGAKVSRPTQFFTGPSGSQSPIFNAQLPPGNIFGADETGIPELALTPSAEQGYYLFVNPMRPGVHTIRWLASGCTAFNPPQDITYHLTVSPRSR
jgi:hypothetical protein